MKVLMQPRLDIFRWRGGDTTQVLETAKALRLLGLTVDISIKLEGDLSNYDVIHLFTTALDGMFWTYPWFQRARAAKKPVVVSTIYWPLSEHNDVSFARSLLEQRRQARGFLSKVKQFVPPWLKYGIWWLISRRKPYIDYNVFRIFNQNISEHEMKMRQQKVWCSADVLLPNSEAEAQVIIRDVNKPIRYIVVPNAVNASIFGKATADEFITRYGIKDFVLCAGVITPRKNQLRLVRAVRDLPLVLIGETRPFFKTYVEKCKHEAGPEAIFLDAMEQSEVASAYAAAKVHVLASEFETPGLSNLEAALAGCNIVSTTGGCTQEYFGDYAWYCDPGDTQSIRKAVQGAYESPYSEELAQRIRNEFTWDMAAKATLKGYELAHQVHEHRSVAEVDRTSGKNA